MLHYRILNNFEKEYTLYELSTKYNIEEKELYKELEEYYTSKGNLKRFKQILYNIENNPIKNNIKVVLEEFESGKGERSLANKYNTTRWNVRKVIKEYYELVGKLEQYEEIRNKNEKTNGSSKYSLTDEIQEDLKNNISINQISKKYNIPYTSLRRLLGKEKKKG